MAFLAILAALAVAGIVIACFILYWMIMIMLIVLGIAFLFWAYLFAYIFDGNLIFLPCAVVATGLTFWAINVYSEKSDKKKARGGS